MSKTLDARSYCFISVLFALLTITATADVAAAPTSPDRVPPVATHQPPAGGQESPAPRRQVKTIGIIGGVSWVSSLEYYRIMNEMVRDLLGDPNSAAILMYSIPFGDFAKQERLALDGNWQPLRETMLDAAARLKRGGAGFIVVASNTMNSTAELIEEKIGIPVLHIADATGEKIKASGLRKVALLGTKYTMEAPFYRDRLAQRYGLDVVLPNATERDYINTVIFDELVNGRFRPESRAGFQHIIERLVREEGAQGIILGCTEIPLLIKQEDVSVPVFDTLTIHAKAAVDNALSAAEGN